MNRPSRPTLLVLALAVAVAGLLAGCGRSGYQYVENGDDTVFVKIPDDWDVVSKGNVDYAITPDDSPQRLPGENVVPWRAVFNAAPDVRLTSADHVAGFVEVQPVDRRMRAELDLRAFFPVDLTTSEDGTEVVRHVLVTAGEISGHRIAWRRVTETGQEIIGDRLVMTDGLNSVVYTVGVGCSVVCYTANATSIDEIMDTFTVED